MFPDFLREVLQNKMMSARQAAIDMRKKNGLPMTQCVRFRLRRSKRSISEDLLAKIVSRHVRQAVNSTTNGTNTTTTSVPTTTTSVPTTTKPTTAPANVYAQAAQQVRDTIVSVVTQIFDALTPLLKNGPLVDIQAIQAHQLLQGLSVQLGMMLGSASAVLQGKPMTPDMDFCNCSAQKQSSSNNSYPPPSNGVNGDDYELLKDNATGSCVDAAADGKPLMACGMCVRKFRACRYIKLIRNMKNSKLQN